MIARRGDRVLVQGITGKQGTFWTERMQDYGGNVVGGVNPKRAGTTHLGVPVHAGAREAMARGGFDISILFVPPLAAKDAAMDAIDAGAKGVVVLAEHVPQQDTLYLIAAARASGTWIVGPNTTGMVTPGECTLGFMPAFNERIIRPGGVGVVSRSGSLGTLFCLNMVTAGFGQSAFIGIGGDPITGTTLSEALAALDRFERTEAVVIVGEIGGAMEEEAAAYARTMKKPVIAFIAGGAAPEGKRMGHAGAIVADGRGTHASKRTSLAAAGVVMLDTPSEVGSVLAAALAGRSG